MRWRSQTDLATWWAIHRWRIAEETGWTLEYIDDMSMADVQEWLSVRDGETKASPVWKG